MTDKEAPRVLPSTVALPDQEQPSAMSLFAQYDGTAFEDVGEEVTWELPTKVPGSVVFDRSNSDKIRKEIIGRTRKVEVKSIADSSAPNGVRTETIQHINEEGLARATVQVRIKSWSGPFFILDHDVEAPDGRVYRKGTLPPVTEFFLDEQPSIFYPAAEEFLSSIDRATGRSDVRQELFRDVSSEPAQSPVESNS